MSPSMVFLRQSRVDVNQCLTSHRKDQIRGTIAGDTFPLVEIDYISRNRGGTTRYNFVLKSRAYESLC